MGYRVESVQLPAEAFENLKHTKKEPYSLVIAVSLYQSVKGDQILEQAKKLSPDTQRILAADHTDFELFVQAINSADIHSCMPLPFTNEDLLYQVEQRCGHFDTGRRLEALKRTTKRQNMQLHQLAESFMKKEALYSLQSENLEKEIRILESRIKAGLDQGSDDSAPITLKDLLIKKNTRFNPPHFYQAFLDLNDEISRIIEIVAARNNLSIPSISYENFWSQSPAPDEYQSLARQNIEQFFSLLHNKETQAVQIYKKIKSEGSEQHFVLDLSGDRLKAHISLTRDAPASLGIYQVKRFLEEKQIVFGLISDGLMENWLYDENLRNEPLLIAKGKAPKPPVNAQIHYHFPTDYRCPGKINPDGSIDFRDRGNIPYVSKDDLLASKTFPETGEFGMDVQGNKIPVAEPVDLEFSAGSGTWISEEQDAIYSTINGQPHLDPRGTVSVCTEYEIKGDIGFDTGNVEFDGNVVVSGSVMQGFKVKCTSLTAKEIHGAEIDVSGDLNVSMGIVDTQLVHVKGNIQAKFVRNSKIHAFGDLMVQKEIIDSQIYLSGACINERGLILNSIITAKRGIQGGTVGNQKAPPSSLSVGIDENVNQLLEKMESELTANKDAIKRVMLQIAALETENQDLHARISQNAHIQDRAQLEIKKLEKKMAQAKINNDRHGYKKCEKLIKALSDKAREAEQSINDGFERQDEISWMIAEKQHSIDIIETKNKDLINERKALEVMSSQNDPVPEITISKYIEAQTKIYTPHASKFLSQPNYRCRIREKEISVDEGNLPLFFEVTIES